MRVHLRSGDNRPLYVQIMEEIRRGLVRGVLGPNDPLPSVRELGSDLRVNPRTVSQAYAELEREGVVQVRPGKGTFVSPDVHPDRDERPRLAREVARRTLEDAARSGLLLADVIEALKEIQNGSARKDRTS
ncbi:MAG: GntR family transcriptional regulator [Gemmatimonadetes bacterium]|nr:GntR family transcriptional regulator [Gemmatimonadota bacterium]